MEATHNQISKIMFESEAVKSGRKIIRKFEFDYRFKSIRIKFNTNVNDRPQEFIGFVRTDAEIENFKIKINE
jgi:hypothetical protein